MEIIRDNYLAAPKEIAKVSFRNVVPRPLRTPNDAIIIPRLESALVISAIAVATALSLEGIDEVTASFAPEVSQTVTQDSESLSSAA